MPQIRVSETTRKVLDELRVSPSTYSNLPLNTRPSHDAAITKLISDHKLLKHIKDNTT